MAALDFDNACALALLLSEKEALDTARAGDADDDGYPDERRTRPPQPGVAVKVTEQSLDQAFDEIYSDDPPADVIVAES